MTTAIVTGTATPAKPLPTHAVVLRKGPRGRPVEPKTPISREAQRIGAAILEVLAGVRTPTDAAMALGIAVPGYYLWEQRALEGLVAACQPRSKGQVQSQRHQIVVLQKEVARLKQDCARQQALVRAAQRTIGLAPPPVPKPAAKSQGKAASKDAGKKARKRRPVVRALRAAAALRTASDGEEPSVLASGAPSGEALQQSVVATPSPMAPASTAAASG